LDCSVQAYNRRKARLYLHTQTSEDNYGMPGGTVIYIYYMSFKIILKSRYLEILNK
jgi:hypothetical protein